MQTSSMRGSTLAARAWAGAEVAVEQVHLAAGETFDTAVVAFATQASAERPFALVRLENETVRFNGTTTVFSEDNPKGAQFHHRVQLTGLPALTDVSYQACVELGKEAACSSSYSFRTVHHDSAWEPEVLVFGDLGHNGGELVHKLFTALPAIEAEVSQGNVDMVIHLGDFAYDLHNDGGARGDEFMRRIEPIAATTFYQTVPGNHEILGGNFSHYRARFHMPRKEELEDFRMWWSMDLGKMHLVGLSTEIFFGRPVGEQAAMLQWLEEDLSAANENRAERPWIVTLGHRPPYCSNADHDCLKPGSEGETVRQMLEELLYRQKVDVAFWAHEHSYERLWPVFNYSVTQKDYVNPQAPVHVISGAAGCNEGHGFCLNPIINWPAHDWSAFRTWGVFHPYSYGHLRAPNATHLYLDQVNAQTGHIFDAVWITKDAPLLPLSV
jgi:3',5'-cyclic AMP phosphodiesterase CpdA